MSVWLNEIQNHMGDNDNLLGLWKVRWAYTVRLGDNTSRSARLNKQQDDALLENAGTRESPKYNPDASAAFVLTTKGCLDTHIKRSMGMAIGWGQVAVDEAHKEPGKAVTLHRAAGDS